LATIIDNLKRTRTKLELGLKYMIGYPMDQKLALTSSFDEIIAKNTAAMAQGVIGETVQNVAEVPVAAQAAEKTPAAAHVSKADYENSLGSFSHEISLDPIDAARKIFKDGLDIINERKGSTLTNDLTETDFGLAA
jgi:hypothetical protein